MSQTRSGPNGANPHHEAGDRTIEVGDAIVLDFGGLMDGYGSDTSRTVCVGEPSAEVREVHDIVRVAQQAGVEAVRPGVPCQEIDRAARKVITEAGYGEQFIHRTGHGIGTTTHEPPYMIEGEEQPLVPGMYLSVEPGIYPPGGSGCGSKTSSPSPGLVACGGTTPNESSASSNRGTADLSKCEPLPAPPAQPRHNAPGLVSLTWSPRRSRELSVVAPESRTRERNQR